MLSVTKVKQLTAEANAKKFDKMGDFMVKIYPNIVADVIAEIEQHILEAANLGWEWYTYPLLARAGLVPTSIKNRLYSYFKFLSPTVDLEKAIQAKMLYHLKNDLVKYFTDNGFSVYVEIRGHDYDRIEQDAPESRYFDIRIMHLTIRWC